MVRSEISSLLNQSSGFRLLHWRPTPPPQLTQFQKKRNFTTLLDPGDVVVATGATGVSVAQAEVTASTSASGFFGSFFITAPDGGG